MHLALASCSDLPGWERDDLPFHDALRAKGISFEQLSWDDPSASWERFDACLIRTTWDYTARVESFLAWAEACSKVTQIWNTPKVLRWNADKSYLRAMEAAGVPCVPTLWLEPGQEPVPQTGAPR